MFKCKWRNTQKNFAARIPHTVPQLTQLIKEQFAIESGHAFVLKEYLRCDLDRQV